jgi:hypothetical protein
LLQYLISSSVQHAEARVSVRSDQLNEFMDTFLDEDYPIKTLEIQWTSAKYYSTTNLFPVLRA